MVAKTSGNGPNSVLRSLGASTAADGVQLGIPGRGRCAADVLALTLDPGIRGLVSGENDSKLTFEVGDHNPSSSSDFGSEISPETITVMPSCRSD